MRRLVAAFLHRTCHGAESIDESTVYESGDKSPHSIQEIWRFVPFRLLVLASSIAQADTQETHRVYAHLLVRDPFAAVQEAKKGLLLFPESKPLQVALIRSLCESGDESEALEEWKRAVDQFQIDPQDLSTETLAWGVLSKGEHSSQISIRMNALIGACITHDARAIRCFLPKCRGVVRS